MHVVFQVRNYFCFYSILNLIYKPINTIFLVIRDEPVVHVMPCQPSPCGQYSQCRVVNDHAVCSCISNYIGSPPYCKPECVVSSECAQDRTCINQKCKDPCPGTCGINARCQVVNHNPICSCNNGFNGDPFVRCIQEESKHVVFNFIFFFLFRIRTFE